MRVVRLLDHRPEQAREVRRLSAQDVDAEVDVAQQSLERLHRELIGGGGEHPVRHGREVIGRLERQLLLALEVVEEAPLGEPRHRADVLNACRRVALAPDDLECRTVFSKKESNPQETESEPGRTCMPRGNIAHLTGPKLASA